ncbi:hypothetical protein [Corynebacterium pilosum]|uniref:Secreted protein n=1 Tax=Corynebacterium pilosum TaxID=35756 RepID=A0A376CKT0_9CORY|nr:hypothetical protein [Corynebacterium pilosum]STC68288.1 Uncharacterised protein [Corynebacterium pilosum]
MNRRISLALATAGAVILAGIAPVQAETQDNPGANPGIEQSKQQPDQTPEKPEGSEASKDDSGSSDEGDKGGSSGSSDDKNSTGFPHSSKDPEKTSSENLSSTLLNWNELSPKAEEAFEWLGLIIGILTAITQAAVIIVPILKNFM